MNVFAMGIARMKLALTWIKARTAKGRLTGTLENGRQNNELISLRYENFIEAACRLERQKVTVERIRRNRSGCPILDIPNNIGTVVLTQGAKRLLTALDVNLALERHKNGDWGELAPSDWQMNNVFLKTGYGALLSRYRTDSGTRFCISTDMSHTVTTVRLEGEL